MTSSYNDGKLADTIVVMAPCQGFSGDEADSLWLQIEAFSSYLQDVGMPVFSDKSRELRKLHSTSYVPANILVDLKTMKVIEKGKWSTVKAKLGL